MIHMSLTPLEARIIQELFSRLLISPSDQPHHKRMENAILFVKTHSFAGGSKKMRLQFLVIHGYEQWLRIVNPELHRVYMEELNRCMDHAIFEPYNPNAPMIFFPMNWVALWL